MTKQMRPYGRLYTQGQMYLLLNPQPIARDSCWDNGTYTFFVAYPVDDSPAYPAVHIITNAFVIEMDAGMGTYPIEGILVETPREYDVLTPVEMDAVEAMKGVE
jgi:hypothetical protein